MEEYFMGLPQRIVIGNHSRLVRGMLEKVIRKTPGLEIIANVNDLAELPEVLERVDADWGIILLPPNGKVPNLVKKVVREQGSMRFLLMGVDGSHVRLMYNEPHEVTLDDKNLQDLLDLLLKNQIERMQV